MNNSPLTTLAILAASLLGGTGAAVAQEVESIFIAGQNTDGYYVAIAGAGKLEAAILVDLRDERPARLGARIEVKKRYHAEQEIHYADTAALAASGRQGSGGRDQWYLPGFTWTIGCSADGRVVKFNEEAVGKSPVDFVIQVGIIAPSEEGEPMRLLGDSIAESGKKRVMCGKYSPLPPAT
jgi:hypothetical protein